jgi:hypothetical protein
MRRFNVGRVLVLSNPPASISTHGPYMVTFSRSCRPSGVIAGFDPGGSIASAAASAAASQGHTDGDLG